MSNSETPTDPQELRAEIEQTRAELGETVQELAAKTDVKTRAKQALGDATGRVQRKLSDARHQATQAVATRASTAKQQLAESNLPTPMRRPLPLAALGTAAIAVIVAAVLAARRRRW
jgi:Protein of unknown function (DUF3618)